MQVKRVSVCFFKCSFLQWVWFYYLFDAVTKMGFEMSRLTFGTDSRLVGQGRVPSQGSGSSHHIFGCRWQRWHRGHFGLIRPLIRLHTHFSGSDTCHIHFLVFSPTKAKLSSSNKKPNTAAPVLIDWHSLNPLERYEGAGCVMKAPWSWGD